MDGIAVSQDLYHWKKYPEPILLCGDPGDCDELHVHKAGMICRDGVLFHFYSATCKKTSGIAPAF